jgi:hypothetical protein
MTVDIRQTPTHLHVTVSGDYSFEELKSAIVRVRQAQDDFQSSKVLIDCRSVAGNPGLRERFELVAFTLQLRINSILHGKPSNGLTAVVAKPPLLHPGRYGIRLLIERNLKMTVCNDIEEALDWLGVNAPRPQSSG